MSFRGDFWPPMEETPKIYDSELEKLGTLKLTSVFFKEDWHAFCSWCLGFVSACLFFPLKAEKWLFVSTLTLGVLLATLCSSPNWEDSYSELLWHNEQTAERCRFLIDGGGTLPGSKTFQGLAASTAALKGKRPARVSVIVCHWYAIGFLCCRRGRADWLWSSCWFQIIDGRC